MADGGGKNNMLAEGIFRRINNIEKSIFIGALFIKAFTCAITGTYLIIDHQKYTLVWLQVNSFADYIDELIHS